MSRRLIAVVVVVAVAASACTPTAHDDVARYTASAAFRRQVLLDSLVGTSSYVVQRRAHYASGDEHDWYRHEEWNPPVVAVGVDASTATALPVDDAALSLLELGRRAFFRYPAQLTPYVAHGRDEPAKFGVWRDHEHGIGGFVEVTLSDGKHELAMTCASCHARKSGNGSLAIGAANRALDLGAMMALDSRDPAFAAVRRSWGAGHVDVSSVDGDEPVAIPDLRAVRYQTHLQYSGAVAQTSVLALATRIETLLITSQGGAVRPPPRVALALATYLWSLAPSSSPQRDADADGARLFASRCAGCHRGEGRAGPPVAVEQVGTDATAARSPQRGTGGYRAPSLIGVAQRSPLLHDGSVATLAALLDPARTIGGHYMTRDLAAVDIAALRRFLGDN